ncbi:hypothetical protein QQ045_026245 [Rhodiola kirilowii]
MAMEDASRMVVGDELVDVVAAQILEEFFLFANKKEHSTLKAIDFGLSVFFNPGERFSEIVGSPHYMAPEVLKRNYGPKICLNCWENYCCSLIKYEGNMLDLESCLATAT